MNEKVIPTIMIALSVLAALFYIPTGDIRKIVYWISVAVLTLTVTW